MPTGIARNGKRKCHRRVPPVVIVCEVCGRKREYAPSEVRQRKHIRFCSHQCMGIAYDKRVVLPCDQCGKHFKRTATHIRSRNYCSAICGALGRRKTDAKWRNPSYIAMYMRRYVQSHRESHNRQAREWWRKHPEQKAMQRMARRALAKSNAFPVSSWLEMKKYYECQCLRCGRKEPKVRLEPDHVVALARGGEHTAGNIQPLCRSCNAWKGAKTIDFRALWGKEVCEVTGTGKMRERRKKKRKEQR